MMKVFILSLYTLVGISSLLSATELRSAKTLAALEKSFSSWTRNYEKEKPDSPEELKGQDRFPALAYLRSLRELEEITRQLREDEKTHQDQVNTDILSASDQKNIIAMRNEAIAERIINIVEPPRRGPSTRHQEKLTKGFLLKAKKYQTSLEKSQRDLSKLFDSNRPDERTEKKLDAQISAAKQTLAELNLAFYGPTLESYETPFDSTHPGKAEDFLKLLIDARDNVLKDLRFKEGDPVHHDSQEVEGTIAGMHIRSENLGVVLDVSGSMNRFLEPLREEIAKDFPNAFFREVIGCELDWNIISSTSSRRQQILLSIEDLIIVHGSDSIYWFSDLNDEITDIGILRLGELRKRYQISLYVVSVKNKPPRDLLKLVDGFSQQ